MKEVPLTPHHDTASGRLINRRMKKMMNLATLAEMMNLTALEGESINARSPHMAEQGDVKKDVLTESDRLRLQLAEEKRLRRNKRNLSKHQPHNT